MVATWASLINDAGFWKLFRNGLLHGFPKDTARRTMHTFIQLSEIGLQHEKFRVIFGRWQAGMHEIWGWNLMWQTRVENGRHAVKERHQGRPSPSPVDTEVQGIQPARGVWTSDQEIATLYAQDRLAVWFMAPQPATFRPFGKRLRLTNFAQPELDEHVLRQGKADWLAGARDYTNNTLFDDGGDTINLDDDVNVPVIEITTPAAGTYIISIRPFCPGLSIHSRSVPTHVHSGSASPCFFCSPDL